MPFIVELGSFDEGNRFSVSEVLPSSFCVQSFMNSSNHSRKKLFLILPKILYNGLVEYVPIISMRLVSTSIVSWTRFFRWSTKFANLSAVLRNDSGKKSWILWRYSAHLSFFVCLFVREAATAHTRSRYRGADVWRGKRRRGRRRNRNERSSGVAEPAGLRQR